MHNDPIYQRIRHLGCCPDSSSLIDLDKHAAEVYRKVKRALRSVRGPRPR